MVPLPFERVPTWPAGLRWPHIVPLLFLGLILLALDGRTYTTISICAAYMLGILILPPLTRLGFSFVMDWARHLGDYVDAREHRLDEWTAAETRHFRDVRSAAYCGSAVALGSVAAHASAGIFGETPFLSVILLFCVVAAAFLTGVALRYIFLMNRLVWRSSRFALKSYFSSSMVFQTGNLLSQVHLVAAFGWAAVTWAVLFDSRLQFVVATIAVPAAVCICLSFVLIQLPLHRQLVAYKRDTQRKIDEAIALILEQGFDRISDEHRERIEFLNQQGQRVQALPDWPFQWKNLLSVVASAVGAILPSIVALALDAEKRAEAIRLAQAVIAAAS